MEATTKISSGRIIFLDNLRVFFVLCVVLFHSANAYFSGTLWWPVSENSNNIFIDWLNLFFDSFTMPLLFFIAGYFALPSIRKGIGLFVKDKFKRLGIPWLVCILTICPVLPFIYHFTRNGFSLSKSYLDQWLIIMNNFLRFDFGIIKSLDWLMQNDQFYQRYMWFLSLLLLFFIVFVLVYQLNKKKLNKTSSPSIIAKPALSPVKSIMFIGILSFIVSMAFVFVMLFLTRTKDPTVWFTFGNIIQCQPLRLAVFIIYFIMGIIACRNNWIERGWFSGKLHIWSVSFIIFLIAYLYVLSAYFNSPDNLKMIYGSISLPLYNFLTISTLGLFASLAYRYWNTSTKFNKALSANSYNIYLSHYIFVLIFQLILFTFSGIPAIIKFAFVSVFSLICSYVVSRFVIKPYPKFTVSFLFVLLILMFVFIHP